MALATRTAPAIQDLIVCAATTSTTAVATPVPTSARGLEDQVVTAALAHKVLLLVFMLPAG
jgi:hypothetical protein